MRNSNLFHPLMLALTVATVGISDADKITFSADARLTGTVRSIQESGVVELETELSPDPVFLQSGAVTKVEFSHSESQPASSHTLIELINGDLLPVNEVNLNDDALTVSTENAGRLIIPRSSIQSMQLGVDQPDSIYSGPKNSSEWSRNIGESKPWKFSNGTLISDGPATAARTFKIPEQFILKFTLKWKTNPNIQVSFADALLVNTEAADRYYMNFNGAGLEIKRESSQGKRFQTVILLPRTPDQFPDNQVRMEIRVDRKTSRLQLLINGEPEGTGIDPIPAAPAGNGISFINSAASGSTQEIREIEILELENLRARHRSEDRGDTKTDSLISRDDDRWSGRIIRISPSSEGAVFLFKSDFQNEPLELVEADVSTIFFAQPQGEKAALADHSFALRLWGGGSLQVSSCAFSPQHVTAQHPLLGPLRINRSGVVAIEWLNFKPQTKAEP